MVVVVECCILLGCSHQMTPELVDTQNNANVFLSPRLCGCEYV